jgi:hypothetical protein
VALNVQYTIDVFKTGALLRIVPPFLRPCVILGSFDIFRNKADPGFSLVNKLISNVPQRTRDGLKHLSPLIAARRKQRESSNNTDERPVCLSSENIINVGNSYVLCSLTFLHGSWTKQRGRKQQTGISHLVSWWSTSQRSTHLRWYVVCITMFKSAFEIRRRLSRMHFIIWPLSQNI